MSRIGKQPITVPSGVDVTIDGGHVAREGPEGHARARLVGDDHDRAAKATQLIVDARPTTRARTARCTGCTRSLVANMVIGVSDGFVEGARDRRRRLPRRGAGPATARDRRSASRTPCTSTHPTASRSRSPAPTRITVRGYDKQLVGQVAADIRKIRKPEPYKGKGIRYAGEQRAAQSRQVGQVAGTAERRCTTDQSARERRHRRVRKKVQGTAERPRLAVFRSNKHIYVQVDRRRRRPHARGARPRRRRAARRRDGHRRRGEAGRQARR